jgi:uncharacterized RDD family membrane protein YckC
MEPIEKLTIDTPEQVGLEFPLAGLGSRFLAFAIDTLWQVVVGLVAVLLMVLVIPGMTMFGPSAGIWAVAVWGLGAFIVYWGYFAVFEALWKGQTPGKRELGIRVIKDTGAGITPQDAMARNLLRAVDSLPGFYGVGIITMFLSDQNKRLGDYVAGTVVVHERPAEESRLYWNTREAAGEEIYAMPNMSPQELEMLENFLARRIEIESDMRYRLAHEIADRLAKRIPLRPEERPRDEDLIEAVVRQYRKSASFRVE